MGGGSYDDDTLVRSEADEVRDALRSAYALRAETNKRITELEIRLRVLDPAYRDLMEKLGA